MGGPAARDVAPELVERVVERVLARLNGSSTCKKAPVDLPTLGIFERLDDAVSAAKEAHLALEKGGLGLRQAIVAKVRERFEPEIRRISEMAVSETGFGRVEDKVAKNTLAVRKTPGCEMLMPRAVSGDAGLALTERAAYGVIGSITPVTNPTETIICNSIGMIAAGNAVVFNAHPNAKGVSNLAVHLVNEASLAAGGPANIAASTTEPTIASAQAMMKHAGIRLLVVTGGPGVVKAAMASGKRAICAGPGNPPVVVDETADIAKAARDIILGASLDNNIVCVVEKEIIAVEAIAKELLAALESSGARLLSADEFRKLTPLLFDGDPSGHKPNRDMVGKDAAWILAQAGIPCDKNARLAVAETPVDHPLVLTEQLMPVLPFVRVKDAREAIRLAVFVEGGNRHTAVVHSKDISVLSDMARAVDSSLFVKNAPSFSGLGLDGEDYCSYTIASPTGEGLTGPIHFTRERRCTLKDYFRII